MRQTFDQRRVLLVDRAALAVEVRLVVVGIEDLHFVAAHQEHTAVAASLARTFDLFGRRPLDVHLAVTEHVLAGDLSLAGNHVRRP